MKKKLISIITVSALLITSLSTAVFANDRNSVLDNNGGSAYADRGEHKNSKDWNKSDKELKTVSESVYGNDDKGVDGDKGKATGVGAVAEKIYTYTGDKTPAEVIDQLLDENVSLKTIGKAINILKDNEEDKYSDIDKTVLDAYSEALLAKVDSLKEEIQTKIDALEELTDLYDKMGDLEKAINIQKKAIMSDYKNILSYKKIGQIFNKKGDKDIKVFTVGEQVYFQDVKPVIKSDRTLVPIRAISESLKSDVQWDEATQTVTITKGDTEIKLVLGNNTAIINGEEVKLDVPAESINNRTMVPVRFISEAFKSTVEWEPDSQIIVIY